MTADPPHKSATPLSHETALLLTSLAATVTSDEATWISGYLAGLVAGRTEGAVRAAPSVSEGETLSILFGSQTGHAKDLAQRIGRLATERGLAARTIDLADFKSAEIKQLHNILLVISTQGEGDPPDSAKSFYEYLQGRRAPQLVGTHFAVLGLGDSSYRKFCQTAKDFDARLEALGAKRLHPRQDCDVDYNDTAASWIDGALGAFTPLLTRPVAAMGPESQPVAASALYDAAHPFNAPLLDSVRLTGRHSDKETWHVELSLEGSGLAYEPGDALGVVPTNDPALVAELIGALDLDPTEKIEDGAAAATLLDTLTRAREITLATPRFVAAYGEKAKSRKLKSLAKPESRDDLDAYLAGRQIADIVREFPIKGLGGATFAGMLRKLQPRLYSLASAPAAVQDEAHLTVSLVRFGDPARTRYGVASGHLCRRLGPDQQVPVYVAANDHFRLPKDNSRPIIMVGAGTGVAPFRAFLQHREAEGDAGRSWLFFGERRLREDFLYQVEWQRWIKTGALTRMDVAFSRDQAEKIYVQNRVRERASDLFAWLEDGAHFYVCGDAAGMAPAVERALLDVIAEQGALDQEAAKAYLAHLQQEGRYQRDIY